MRTRTRPEKLWLVSSIILALISVVSCGGGGTPSATKLAATLTTNVSTLSFGSVMVGNSKSQSGSLTAGGADITISTAAWNGQGYSLSGISFPVTVAAGSSIPFTVTFSPQVSGTANGQISFLSDAPNSPVLLSLSGSGTQSHSVSLSWNASASPVVGYNIYRANPGGQYTKLNSSPITVLTFDDRSVQSGATYSYAATSVDASNVESGYSNIANATIP